MITTYPKKISEIDPYAKREGIDRSVARQRFAQYGLLKAFSYSKELSSALALKGGNALNAFWILNRSTRDLDFSINKQITLQEFETRLNGTFKKAQTDLGILFRIQRGRKDDDPNPPSGPTFQVLRMRVAFALDGEFDLTRRIESGTDLELDNTVPLEVAADECVCETVQVQVDGLYPLKLCTIEDIMAEKLRSLLQQILRGTTRKQDVLDLAVIIQEGIPFDLGKVSEFLRQKAPMRHVIAVKTQFKDPRVKALASTDYETMRGNAKVFIPFEEAFTMVMGLVDSLAIPD